MRGCPNRCYQLRLNLHRPKPSTQVGPRYACRTATPRHPPPPLPRQLPQAVAERHFPYPLAGCGFLHPDGCALVPVVRDSVAGGVRLRMFAAGAAAGRLPELVQVRLGCLRVLMDGVGFYGLEQ